MQSRAAEISTTKSIHVGYQRCDPALGGPRPSLRCASCAPHTELYREANEHGLRNCGPTCQM
jgi:hypothetical protein